MRDPIIERNFTYHKPNDDQVARMETFRNAAKDLAYEIKNEAPLCYETSVAMEKLSEVVMWVNAAIAREVENVSALRG